MTERSEKRQNLINYVRNEISAYQTGEILSLTTFDELYERFEYANRSSVIRILNRVGLTEERRLARELGPRSIPSRSMAWMIGFLAGGGYIGRGLNKGKVIMTNLPDELVQPFKGTAESLFSVNIAVRDVEFSNSKGNKGIRTEAYFADVDTTSMLGDLRRDKWPSTVVNRHRWCLNNEDYTWALLEGFFELKGYIDSRSIYLLTSYPNIASFLTELLVRQGIHRPRIVRDSNHKDDNHTLGVQISNWKEAQHFALHIRSHISKKEEILDEFRRRVAKRKGPMPGSMYSREEMITEWQKAKLILGHSPNSNELNKLQKEGRTRFSFHTYSRWFGGSIKNVTGTLEDMLTQKESLDNTD